MPRNKTAYKNTEFALLEAPMPNIDPHAHNPLDSHDEYQDLLDNIARNRSVRDFASDRQIVPTLHYSRRRAVWMRIWVPLLAVIGWLSAAGLGKFWMLFWLRSKLSDALWATAFTIVAIACILQLGNKKGDIK